MANAPVVAMATFSDYLVAPGGNKRISLVRAQVTQFSEDYNPGRDFYRPMSLAIQEAIRFRTGTAPIDRAVMNARPRAVDHFKEIGDNVGKYVQRAQTAKILDVDRWEWIQPNVTVKINPDFALIRKDGHVDVVKAYYKVPELTRFQADAMLRLLQFAMPHLNVKGTPVILETRRGKEWKPTPKLRAGLDDYLKSEALAYGALWQSLSA
ncbi:hypothetical protein JOF29_005226 [Kribbella aluminosa]|uniref:Uncharacterized protein n=1 Tax=Kribbella aluminosa TaxID=416017 RepID=A0ABS4URB1_9ACTN|nr:hypothetical protein [Kribbella aluminosa]MBP2354116.1 hypothetical protein [Kribbella aluminosa]